SVNLSALPFPVLPHRCYTSPRITPLNNAKRKTNEMAIPILLAKDTEEIFLLPKMANRHGMIAGATGTGKSVTLRVLAENFSRQGIPVFMADVKGDLAGIAQAGGDNPKVGERVQQFGLPDFKYQAYPVVFWDVFGEQGH